MKKVRAFTLIELMVVILIIGVLAAVAIPIMRARSGSAKWTEAKAGMGSISTALRAYAAEKDVTGTYPPSLAELGFFDSDLHGTYFVIGDYSVTAATFTPGADPELTFTVRADKASLLSPTRIELDNTGSWTESSP